MKTLAYRLKTEEALMTGVMALCLFAHVSHGARANKAELWDNGQLNGWVDAMSYGATTTNPGTYLRVAFPMQSILMPQEDGVAGGIEASGGAFYGDYVVIGASDIGFSLMTDGHLPSVIRLVLHSSVSDREWTYAPLELSEHPGEWVANRVPLDFSCGRWRLSGPGATEELFLADLKSVDRIGVRIQQQGTEAQTYCIDEFRLNGPFGTIRGKVKYSGFQAGTVKVIATASASSWSAQYSTELPLPDDYELANMRIGPNYWIKAFLDSNTNGVPDAWEAMGEYPLNELAMVESVDDLDVTLTETKTDDGLPTWWVLKYFGAAGGTGGGSIFSAAADPDGDGLNNWQEYLAGTDPNGADSVFKAEVDSKPSGAGIVLKWKSAYPGQKFGVWRCADLTSGFQLIKGNIGATPPENSFEDDTATGNGPYFYKIQIE